MNLYKYLEPTRVDVLQNRRIRFSQPAIFNDPFELRPYIQEFASEQGYMRMFEEQLPEVLGGEYSKLPAELRAAFPFEQFEALARMRLQSGEFRRDASIFFGLACNVFGGLFADRMNDFVGLLCLTEKPDNLLMWAHYADSHAGFVVGFDSEHSFFKRQRTEHDECGYLRKVSYSDERPALVMTAIRSFDDFFVKSREWEYEQEWRMILPLQYATATLEGTAWPVHLFDLPPDVITTIIVGCRASQETFEGIGEAVSGLSVENCPELFQARIDDKRFALQLVPIG